MINITDPADCCGCTACASICNQDAITMKPDALGFLYPEVDTDKCVECGRCEEVCAFNENYDTSLNLSKPIAYGARQKDIDEIMHSRSGAVFAVLSDYILDTGGVVYGAGYSSHFRVVHKRATTKKERDDFRGSKYVQSDMNIVFRQVKKDLKDGLTVLFSGTPCQTSGLNSYVGKKLRDNLFLIDIVCHGVPGPYIWRDYIKFIENKYGDQIIDVDFRNKSVYGWAEHKETFKMASNPTEWKTEVVTYPGQWHTWFTYLFYKHIMFRHSCGTCHFCNTKRPSDLTLADYWGWQKTGSIINKDDKGLNLVLINTNKGVILFDEVRNQLEIIDAEPTTYMQPNLQYPSHIHKYRMKFEADYKKKGFEYIYKKQYDERPLWRQIASKVYQTILRMFKSLR